MHTILQCYSSQNDLLIFHIPEYIQSVQCEAMKLRKESSNMKKAKSHAKELLPEEPCSLVEKYLAGNQPQSKTEVIANRYSRFTKPALPTENERLCECSGKCATCRCPCKKVKSKCTAACGCNKDICSNK